MEDKEYDILNLELDADLYDALSDKAKNCNMSFEEYCTKLLTDAVKSNELKHFAQKSYTVSHHEGE